MFHQQSSLELIGECAQTCTNIYYMSVLTEGSCWDGIHERGFSSGNYKETGKLNRSLDGNKASGICRSTEEILFCSPSTGHKYYKIFAIFVILTWHILVVKNGISQRFKDRGSKQDDYISQFMFQIIYIHIQVSESCVWYYKSCKHARELIVA